MADIERCAKAMHDLDPWLYGQDLDGEDIYRPWDDAPPAVRKHYEDAARACLRASGAVQALRDIAGADPVDMALDPGWASARARAALPLTTNRGQ